LNTENESLDEQAILNEISETENSILISRSIDQHFEQRNIYQGDLIEEQPSRNVGICKEIRILKADASK